MTFRKLSGIILCGAGGSVLGAMVSAMLFGAGWWLLCRFGFIGTSDAVIRVKVAVFTFTALGFVLGIDSAVRKAP